MVIARTSTARCSDLLRFADVVEGDHPAEHDDCLRDEGPPSGESRGTRVDTDVDSEGVSILADIERFYVNLIIRVQPLQSMLDLLSCCLQRSPTEFLGAVRRSCERTTSALKHCESITCAEGNNSCTLDVPRLGLVARTTHVSPEPDDRHFVSCLRYRFVIQYFKINVNIGNYVLELGKL